MTPRDVLTMALGGAVVAASIMAWFWIGWILAIAAGIDA
jgi:hypothetical protein